MVYKMSRAIICILVLFLFPSFAYTEQYNRTKHFKHWSDLDRNGFNTREDVLIRQSVQTANGNYLISIVGNDIKLGIWVCPYSGKIFYSASYLDIDHVVPLKYAWEHGAENWTDKEREEFANDVDNLLAVNRTVHSGKGDSSPDKWLPPNISFHAEYISKFVSICDRYKLSYNKEKVNAALKCSREYARGIRN